MTTGHSVEDLAVLVTIKSPVGVEKKELDFVWENVCHACMSSK